MNCLSVFEQIVGLTLKELKAQCLQETKYLYRLYLILIIKILLNNDISSYQDFTYFSRADGSMGAEGVFASPRFFKNYYKVPSFAPNIFW